MSMIGGNLRFLYSIHSNFNVLGLGSVDDGLEILNRIAIGL